jgi:hypothetical protein
VEKREMDRAIFETFKEGTDALEQGNVPYVIGGGIAVWAYGRQRWTKDIDVFLKPEDAGRALDVLSAAGFRTEMTDPTWLYKAFAGDQMIDIIFKSRGDIYMDDESLARGVVREIDGIGVSFRFMAPEDLIIRKIFAMHEHRPDWYDSISVIEGLKGDLDWAYFMKRAQIDTGRVLSFLLFAESVYPRDRAFIPFWVIRQLAQQVLDREQLASAA